MVNDNILQTSTFDFQLKKKKTSFIDKHSTKIIDSANNAFDFSIEKPSFIDGERNHFLQTSPFCFLH